MLNFFSSFVPLLLVIFVSFIPIVIWGYLFSYIDDNTNNKKRFFIGILAGGISVIPILYLSDIISAINIDLFKYLNIFSYIHNFSGFLDIFSLFISFVFIIVLISLIPFLFLYFGIPIKEKLKLFVKRTLLFSFYMLIFSVFVYFIYILFNKFDGIDFKTNKSLSFSGIFFDSFKLIIFYYFIVGTIEEISKFFCFTYSKIFKIENIQQGVIYSVFVALGFSFIENILYFYNIFKYGGLNFQFLSVFFSRNLFSVFLHILCTSILSYFFTKLYLEFRDNYNLKFIRILFIGLFLSVILHSLFDIFLNFNLSFFIILYLIGGYFYFTYILYKN